MKVFTSEESACRATLKLWKALYDSEYSDWVDKREISRSLFGKICCDCPCCEYADMCKYNGTESCKLCPMIDFWIDRNDKDKNTLCENIESPYNKWKEITGNTYEYSNKVSTDPAYIKMKKEYISNMLDRIEAAIEYWYSMKEMNTIW